MVGEVRQRRHVDVESPLSNLPATKAPAPSRTILTIACNAFAVILSLGGLILAFQLMRNHPAVKESLDTLSIGAAQAMKHANELIAALEGNEATTTLSKKVEAFVSTPCSYYTCETIAKIDDAVAICETITSADIDTLDARLKTCYEPCEEMDEIIDAEDLVDEQPVTQEERTEADRKAAEAEARAEAEHEARIRAEEEARIARELAEEAAARTEEEIQRLEREREEMAEMARKSQEERDRAMAAMQEREATSVEPQETEEEFEEPFILGEEEPTISELIEEMEAHELPELDPVPIEEPEVIEVSPEMHEEEFVYPVEEQPATVEETIDEKRQRLIEEIQRKSEELMAMDAQRVR